MTTTKKIILFIIALVLVFVGTYLIYPAKDQAPGTDDTTEQVSKSEPTDTIHTYTKDGLNKQISDPSWVSKETSIPEKDVTYQINKGTKAHTFEQDIPINVPDNSKKYTVGTMVFNSKDKQVIQSQNGIYLFTTQITETDVTNGYLDLSVSVNIDNTPLTDYHLYHYLIEES